MFWILVLAHLTADYPLQTDRMVLAKQHLPGLLLHVSVHLGTMMLLFWPVLRETWPFLVIVAVAHFFIDAFKNFLSHRRPQWVIGSYILDQILHFSSLILVSAWMAHFLDLPAWTVTNPWVAYISGLLTATYIWFVSERIMVYKIDNRQIAVSSTMWPRMGIRLALYVLAVAPFSFSLFLLLAAIAVTAFLYNKYSYLRSWLFVDVGVAVISALLVRVILLIFGN